MNYILFTPVGTTDPISDQHDGAILHICRKYKPKKVYLYLSKEMLGLHDKDNRFCDAIERLGKLLSHTFEVECIARPDLVDVQVFDNFYMDFEGIIEGIKKEHPEDTILLNVSSGTPAMKSALQWLAALSDGSYLPIQVASPNKRSNPRRENIYEYNKDDSWEYNFDNLEGYVDRCKLSSTLNLTERIKTEVIKRHLDVYDYHAAYSIAESMHTIDDKARSLLQLASNRILLKQSEVDKLRSLFEDPIIPVLSGDARKIVEYLLWLDIKLKRKEYVDFIRGITPIVVNMLDLYMQKQMDINIRDYCKKISPRGNDVYLLTRNELMNTEKGLRILTILDERFNQFNDTFYSAAHLTEIIKELSDDKELIDRVNLLRQVEESVRNIAAHEIIYVDEEFIQKQSSHSTKQIIDALWFLLKKAMPSVKPEIRNSYDDMNSLIKSYL